MPKEPPASKVDAAGLPATEGDSFQITTPGVSGMHRLSDQTFTNKVTRRVQGGPGRVFSVLIYSPDGSDPGVAANTTTVYVGENGSSGFPLAPGKWRVFRMTDPAEIGIDDRGTAATLFVSYGGKYPD